MVRTSFPEQIQIFLNDVVADIVEELDPLYVLIAGSFGKGSWIYDNQKLLSDFELVFVSDKRWPLKKKKKLLTTLNSKYRADISLKGYLSKKVKNKISSNYSNRYPGYVDLNFFDTFSIPRMLYQSEDGGFESLTEIKPNEIPVWEAWRLFVNRIGEWLELTSKENHNEGTLTYLQIKIWESAADTFLILNRNYASDINFRLKIFSDMDFSDLKKFNKDLVRSVPLMEKALIARQNHSISDFDNYEDNVDLMYTWLKYLEKKLSESEKLSNTSGSDFYSMYCNNRNLQNKYLGFTYGEIIKSNLTRIIFHNDLLEKNFKFFNHHISWRHMILILVSSFFSELYEKSTDFEKTKMIFSQFYNERRVRAWSNKLLLENIFKYWKKLR